MLNDRWFKISCEANRKQCIVLGIGQRIQERACSSIVIERREALNADCLLKLSVCVHGGVQASSNE